MNSANLNQGGKERLSPSYNLTLDTIGEVAAGRAQSASYSLNSGFIPTVQSNPPVFTQPVPNLSWRENELKVDLIDLDDYFSSPDGYALNFSVSGNYHIAIVINPDTHKVTFSQPTGWNGTERVIFTATDLENSTVQSNEVTLQVEAVENPPVLDNIANISARENDLITLRVRAVDLDDNDINFTYSDLFRETRHWKEGGAWYSEATWQTNYNSAGIYTITVTAADTTGLIDTRQVTVNVQNVNRPPALEPISDITANEGDLITVKPQANDTDGDAITYYYSAPLDQTGKWLTDYDDAGNYTATVTASDGMDTALRNFNITVNNTNRAPQANLTLSKYTVQLNELITATLSATDPDGDPMIFSLKKDGSEIASGNIASTYITTTSFSNIGDHNISATVTDSGGLYSTEITAGVDVVDPNANREYINPVMGDFNGDALSDLGLHNSQTGKWEICLSDKGVFRNAVDWLANFGASKDWWPLGGDFNGDGRTDIGIFKITSGELQIALSSGSGFSASGTWLTASGYSYQKQICQDVKVCRKVLFWTECEHYTVCDTVTIYPWLPFTGNFNGDKFTDFALYNTETGEVRVALGTGSGFGALNTWISGFGSDYVAMSGDFNADGLSDLCLFKKSSGEFKIAFSNSNAFVDGTTWISGFATDKDALISDFNNDGLADIGYWDKSSYRWYYAVSTGARFINKGIWISSFGASGDDSASTGDFDGNGVTDAATFNRDNLGINRWTVRISQDRPADLLTEIDNGIGGTTQVNYSYAALSDNDLLPFPVYVASNITLVDTLPQGSTPETYRQDFNFSGGYYDAQEREFRGFAKIRVTDPITRNYSETYFYQGKPGENGALKGQIYKILAFDGNSRQISQTLNTFEVRIAGPEDRILGFPALKEQLTTVWEENAAALTTRSRTNYDNIGNVIEQIEDGDMAVTGDEKSATTTYAQAYGVGFNRPLEAALKDASGNIVTQKNLEYDTRGNLARAIVNIIHPFNPVPQQAIAQYTYDAYGNLLTATNALGYTASTTYEHTYYTYPQRVTNALGHTVTYEYDYKLGLVTSVTDVNGKTAETIYDALGRTVETRNALGQTITTYSYPDFNTKITRQLGFTKTEYIDGLGRKYKTITNGEDGVNRRDVVAETFYNNRGQVSVESLPHYYNENPSQVSYVRYEYDIRGRITRTTSDFPGTAKDAYATVSYINPLYVETIDPLGHKKGTKKDASGNVVEVSEFTVGGVYKTSYVYDVQGNLLRVTDSKNNIIQIFYDSLGRKVKMIDPDMGTWVYEYDLLGNLIRQTDAKGQILEFNYDWINRLTAKLGTGSVLASYYYDSSAGAKPNSTGRLSKIVDRSGSTEFFYDELGRETKSVKIVDGTAYTVERTYDILDRLLTLKYPDGEIVTYSYDNNSGLLEKVQGQSSYVQDITYNAQGQMRNIKYGNNVQTNYAYGADLRLSRILTQGSSATLQNLNYVFDKNGNVVTLTDNLRSNIRTYIYDDLDRLKEARNVPSPAGGYTTFTFQYDSIGNMIYKSDLGVMTYGLNAGPHALTGAGGYTYQYDVNGNMVVGKNKILNYDIENRLISVNELGVISSFVYDGDGGRVKKTTGQASTIYIGSLFEKDSSGKLAKHIFAGSNRVVTVESTGSLYYYHSDHLGSSNVISNSSGGLLQHCEYTPYGTLARNEGTDVAKHKFTGKELDCTGLYFYGARYYDPVIGRFITADTIVQAPYDPQSLNRYSYCRNNPINYVDPTGHIWWWVIPAIIGAIIGAVSAGIQSNWNLQAMLVGAAIGAVSGVVGFGAAGVTSQILGRVGSAVFGGMLGGATAGLLNSAYYGGDLLRGTLMGAGLGALGGLAFGTLSQINVTDFASALTKVSLYAAAGGGLSELGGGEFWQGAVLAGTVAMSEVVYIATLSTNENGRKNPNPSIDVAEGNAKDKLNADGTVKTVLHNDGSAEVGIRYGPNTKNGFFNENSPAMQWIAKNIPIFQGVARIHDPWSHFYGTTPIGFTNGLIFNIPSMLPAFAITVLGTAAATAYSPILGQFAIYGED